MEDGVIITPRGSIRSLTYVKLVVSTLLLAFIIQSPLGDPCKHLPFTSLNRRVHHIRKVDYVCEVYNLSLNFAQILTEMFRELMKLAFELLYQIKIKVYKLLALIDGVDLCHYACRNKSVTKQVVVMKNKSSQ